jgi:hypothetical protein
MNRIAILARDDVEEFDFVEPLEASALPQNQGLIAAHQHSFPI